jgi:hypothetical protein
MACATSIPTQCRASVPKGRVLMHNHVLHDANTPSSTNGFRGWTAPSPPAGFVQCHCGWAHGLPHYARADAAVEPTPSAR